MSLSVDGQGTKWRRKIAENFNRLSSAQKRYRQTDDGRAIAFTITNKQLLSGVCSITVDKMVLDMS